MKLADSARLSDALLRPATLTDYVGQSRIKRNLSVALAAAKLRREPLEHVLLSGPPGLGKTTLARIIASEMTVPIHVTSGPAIEKSGDLASILACLAPGDVLFIDEIHRLNRTIEEMLYPVMEDWGLDIILGKGPAARTMRLDVAPFTLVGATTRPGNLSSPLRDRFGLYFHLDFYAPAEMNDIVKRSAKLLHLNLTPSAVTLLAGRSRATPRVANRLTKRARDFSQVRRPGQPITPALVNEALGDLGIDNLGLDDVDRRLLLAIIDNYGGGPVGSQTLSAAVSLEPSTLEDVYEPYLMRIGLLERTARGRRTTAAALRHLKNRPALL